MPRHGFSCVLGKNTKMHESPWQFLGIRHNAAYRRSYMYKRQLTFQKIICFFALAACALAFIYALGIMTDLYDSLYYTMMDPTDPDDTWVQGSQVYYHMQPFNRQLLNYSIVMILFACLLFITGTHSRRRYYIGNIVSTGVFAVSSVAYSVFSHINIEKYKAEFLKIDFEELEFFADLYDTPYIDSTFWFDAHYAVFGVLLLAAALLIVNMIAKFVFMRAERRLIEEGKKVL